MLSETMVIICGLFIVSMTWSVLLVSLVYNEDTISEAKNDKKVRVKNRDALSAIMATACAIFSAFYAFAAIALPM